MNNVLTVSILFFVVFICLLISTSCVFGNLLCSHLLYSSSSLYNSWSSDLGYVQKVSSQVLSKCYQALTLFEQLGHVVETDRKVVLPDMSREWGLAMGIQEMLMLKNSLADQNRDQMEYFFHRSWSALENMKVKRIGHVQRSGFQLNEALKTIFQQTDILITPCLPIDAFQKSGPMPISIDGEKLQNPMHIVGFMYPFNFSGHPSIVLRIGMSDQGLPLGIQLVAERYNDSLLLRIGKQYEAISGCYDYFPTPKEILSNENGKKSKM